MPNNILALTFDITNRCNLHCRICGIWKERPRHDLALADIQKILLCAPNLKSVSLTGGEALLHPDIDAIYRHLCTLFLKKRLTNIDIATNAYDPLLLTFLKRHQKLLRPLSLSVSLDGIGAIHDTQRGTPGAFERVIAHVRAVKALGVPVALKFTASRLNYTHLPRVALLAHELKCSFSFKLVERLPSYYHRTKNERPPLLGKKDRAALHQLILQVRRLPALRKNSRMFDWHLRFLKEGSLDFIQNCQTPEHALFITSNGNIYNCLYQKPLSTLAEWPARKATTCFNNIRRGANGTCPKCLAYHGSLQTLTLPARDPIPGRVGRSVRIR
ncbi:MAG: radical SAM protein [Candidatus Omnitrophica bacterium]|nr:radical SAM protein [Candidatus Omnitrophota bacterium]